MRPKGRNSILKSEILKPSTNYNHIMNIISKIENAVLVSSAFALLVFTLWNFGSVMLNLSAYTATQVYDTILLTAMLLIFQLGIVGIIYAKKN